MGTLGFPELLVILAVVLLVFGPSKLPALGSSLGQAIREFKRGLSAKKELGGDREQKD
jgi:sec-independent protein translocase protein TatA